MSPLGQSPIVSRTHWRQNEDVEDDFYPVCARPPPPPLPNPKMKGQKLAPTLAARMATCAFSAASLGEKTVRV